MHVCISQFGWTWSAGRTFRISINSDAHVCSGLYAYCSNNYGRILQYVIGHHHLLDKTVLSGHRSSSSGQDRYNKALLVPQETSRSWHSRRSSVSTTNTLLVIESCCILVRQFLLLLLFVDNKHFINHYTYITKERR